MEDGKVTVKRARGEGGGRRRQRGKQEEFRGQAEGGDEMVGEEWLRSTRRKEGGVEDKP